MKVWTCPVVLPPRSPPAKRITTLSPLAEGGGWGCNSGGGDTGLMEGEAEVWSSQGMPTTGGRGAGGRGVVVGGSGRARLGVVKMKKKSCFLSGENPAADAGIELVGLHRRLNEEWV